MIRSEIFISPTIRYFDEIFSENFKLKLWRNLTGKELLVGRVEIPSEVIRTSVSYPAQIDSSLSPHICKIPCTAGLWFLWPNLLLACAQTVYILLINNKINLFILIFFLILLFTQLMNSSTGENCGCKVVFEQP